jgi:phage anti-repressor protein
MKGNESMENELKVKSLKDQQTPIEIALEIDEEGRTTARKLYDFLELSKGQYSRWAKTNITNNSFAEENVDYKGFDINVEGNNVTDFKLSAEFAKKLAMTSKSAKGEEARDYFIKVESKLKEVVKEMKIVLSAEDKYVLDLYHADTREDMLMLVKKHEEEVVKPLKDSLDRYQRFLCEKTELLTKTQLATKLDTSTGTLAALFKKLNIYTPKSSKLTESFLELFPTVKMFDETTSTYTDKNSGETKESTTWQWTFLGAKSVVDYLIDLGYVAFTENDGFKLKRVA